MDDWNDQPGQRNQIAQLLSNVATAVGGTVAGAAAVPDAVPGT